MLSNNGKSVYLTPEGLRKVQQELDYLRNVRRQELARRLKEAIAQGDLSENADYEDAKNEQAFLEGKIQDLESKVQNAILIEETGPSDVVRIGSTVTVVEEGGEPETYTIVGSTEADPRNGRISNESPLGRSLLGCRVGDSALVQAPAGSFRVRIEAIR